MTDMDIDVNEKWRRYDQAQTDYRDGKITRQQYDDARKIYGVNYAGAAMAIAKQNMAYRERMGGWRCRVGKHRWSKLGRVFETYGAVFVEKECCCCKEKKIEFVTNLPGIMLADGKPATGCEGVTCGSE